MKKFLLHTLFACFVTISCMANHHHPKEIDMLGLFKKADPVEKFWTWFKANEQRLRKFQDDPDKYLGELLNQAKKIKAGLAIELEPPQNGIINLTVSADGDRNLLSLVQQIIQQAPVITGWKFIAFRQRVDTEKLKSLKLESPDHQLELDKMKFFPMPDGDTLDIIIYVKGVTEENYNQVAYGGLLLLDNILGEYDCVTKVRSYDFHEMPKKKEELDNLLPLLDLATYVDQFHRAKKN